MYARLGKPEIRATEFKECFYCKGRLPALSGEHVFNSCWGGKYKTTVLVCDECNGAFSSIDGSFSPYVSFVMNAWEFKGQRHAEVPRIATKSNVVLGPGAKPRLKEPTIVLENEPGGTVHVSVEAGSKGSARQVLLDGDLEKLLGRPLDKVDRETILDAVRNAQLGNTRQTVETQFTINTNNEYRSIAHTALKCLGLYDPVIVRDEAIEKIRNYARYDQGNWKEFAFVPGIHVSPFSSAHEVYGVHFNMCEIFWSRHLMKVVAVVSILGRIERAVVLMEGYEGPADAILSVGEDTRSSGPLKSLYVEFDQTLPPLPLVEIGQMPPTQEHLNDAFGRLAANSVSFDAVQAALLKGLDRISKRSDKLTESVIEEYTTVMEDFVVNFSTILGIQTTRTDIREQLNQAGMSNLGRHIGKGAKDDDIQILLGRALIQTLQQIQKSKSVKEDLPTI